MARLNPPIQILGHLPCLGHALQVYEPYFAIVLAFIGGVHLAVFAASAFWMRKMGNSRMGDEEMGPVGEQNNESAQNLVTR